MPDRSLLPKSWPRAMVASLGGVPALCLIIIALVGHYGGLEVAATRGPLGHLQDKAASYLDRSQEKAVEAFAAGRAINAAISVLKSVEVSPVVARFAPLEVLEPVDDLAKQFSNIMAFSIASILVQRLLLAIAQTWALSVVLPIGCVLWLFAAWCSRWPDLAYRLSALGRSVIILAIFARLVIPIAGWAGDGLTERFLANDLRDAVNAINTASGGLEKFTSPVAKPGDKEPPPAVAAPTPSAPPPPSPGTPPPQTYLGQIGGLFSSAVQGATSIAQGTAAAAQSAVTKGQALLQDIGSWVPDSSSMSAITNTLHGVPDQIVKAIEIFLVQTVLTPVVVAGLLFSALRSVTRPRQQFLVPYQPRERVASAS